MTAQSRPNHTRFLEKLFEFSKPLLGHALDAKKRGDEGEHRPNFGAVFYGHAEIQGTLDSLELIRSLMLRAPPRTAAVKKPDYLRFLVGAYLQEVYILRERLIKYAKKVQRIYKPEGALGRRLEDMAKVVENAFDAMTEHRGAHVHAQRYDDHDLNYTAMLFMVSLHGDHLSAMESAAFAREAAKHYRAQSQKWAGIVADNLESLDVLLDSYFGVLLKVTTASGKFAVPESPVALAVKPRYVRGAAKSGSKRH